MSNNILIYSQYESLRKILLIWMETLCPTNRIIETNSVSQILNLAQNDKPKAVIFEVDQLTNPAIKNLGKIKADAPNLPIVLLVTTGLINGQEHAAQADFCLSLTNFQEYIRPLLLALDQAEPNYKH